MSDIKENEELKSHSEAEIRLDKLKILFENNKNPFENTKYKKDTEVLDIIENFENYEGKQVKCAGRVMSKRIMGKASFSDILDGNTRMQIYFKQDILENEYDFYKKFIDIGDIVGVEGEVFKTHKGEISIKAKKLILLSKSLLPLPEKFHGLKDVDLKYRKRYLDLIMDSDVKKIFKIRSQIIYGIRDFLNKNNFLEVETPILCPILGGANARPFITHHNALNMDLYLRIAPELYLKRLVVGGFEKVYELGRQFRNEGIDTKHNPEFTTIEIYSAYSDYSDMMNLTEEIIKNVAKNITFNHEKIDVYSPFKRITMINSIKEVLNVDLSNADYNDAEKIVKNVGLILPDKIKTLGEIINFLFEEKIEKTLINPTYITEYPVEISPLAKRIKNNKNFTERFELFVLGQELANGFSELNDPIDQKERFMLQVKKREAGDEEANMMDEDFIEALSYGLPPTGGVGIGIDRLVMLFTESNSIRDVLLFPTLKNIIN